MVELHIWAANEIGRRTCQPLIHQQTAKGRRVELHIVTMQNCGVFRLCYRLPGTSPGRIHVRMNREPLCKRVALLSQLLGFLLCEEPLHEQVAMFLIKSDLFLRKHAGPPLHLSALGTDLPLRSLPFTVPLQDYMLMGKILLQQLVRPDVACHSLWSSHPPLVSGDTLDMAVTGGDAIDGHTPWEQGMGLRRSIVVLQQRINPQSRECHLQKVGPMRLVGSKRRVLRVLDEVIALRGELPQNIWTIGRLIPRDKTVSHHQLAC